MLIISLSTHMPMIGVISSNFLRAVCGGTLLLAGVMSSSVEAQSIPEVVHVGGIFDLTGSWSLGGEEGKAAAELAIRDFNEYLETIGADWSMSMQVEDSQTDELVALDKMHSLQDRGMDIFFGMAFSSQIQTAKDYIDTNSLLVISHGSQAANLAIDDTVFRLRPSDDNQAPEVNKMLQTANITVLATISRGDAGGDGSIANVKDHFEGPVIELLRYDPGDMDFSEEVSIMDKKIGELVNIYGADQVGVLYVGTDEIQSMMHLMHMYDNMDDVRWFTTNSQAENPILVEDERAFEFARSTQFTALKYVSPANSIQEYVNDWAQQTYGRNTSVYTYPAYDSVWLLGTAIQQAQTTDVQILKETIPLVARFMIGSTGHLELNEYGDLIGAHYSLVHIGECGWTAGPPPVKSHTIIKESRC